MTMVFTAMRHFRHWFPFPTNAFILNRKLYSWTF
jgi:hypothetical protein